MRIGIDLGGTKTEIALLNEDDQVLYRHRRPTPSHCYQHILETIQSLVRDLEAQFGTVEKIGIGIPGTLKKNGLVKNANTTALIGKPLKKNLETVLGRPIKMANDANCFALSEAYNGAGKGRDVVFGVILGTGCGGAIVVDGKVLPGINGIAGEWGHNPLPAPEPSELPGPDCYCGRKGCIETFISGPGFSADYLKHQTLTRQNLKLQETSLDAHKIVKKAQEGHPCAEYCLKRLETRIAKSLATVINIIDPDIIVLGGGLSNIKRLYTNIPKLWQYYIFSDIINTDFVPAQQGDSSGVLGAARLWNTQTA